MRKKIQVTTTTVYDKVYTKKSNSKKKEFVQSLKKFKSLSIYKIHEQKIDEINNISIRKTEIKKKIKDHELLLKKNAIDEKIYENEIKEQRSEFIKKFEGSRLCKSMLYILTTQKCFCFQCQLIKRFSSSFESNGLKINQIIEMLKQELKDIDEEDMNYMLSNMKLINDYTNLDESTLSNVENDNSYIHTDNIQNNTHEEKNKLIQEYRYNVGLSMRKSEYITDICKECNNNLVEDETNDTLLVCIDCGITSHILNLNTPLSYKESQDHDFKTKFTYDKKSHLIEWLNRLTSKENKEIPQELIDKLMIEIQKEKITDLKTLNEKTIKKYLRKINMTSYYDNIITIINRINGRSAFKLTSQIEDKLHEMFQKTRDPFEKYKPKGRKNFFSYPFILTQFFKILNLDEFTYYLPKLKSQDKVREQDAIFEKIVKELAVNDKSINWKFFSSV